jgi:hypothetical protein
VKARGTPNDVVADADAFLGNRFNDILGPGRSRVGVFPMLPELCQSLILGMA